MSILNSNSTRRCFKLQASSVTMEHFRNIGNIEKFKRKLLDTLITNHRNPPPNPIPLIGRNATGKQDAISGLLSSRS